ncbi:hypothetical protein DAPPUDRAFT_238745 [Daphnia pulex]|uniref:Uncharacterized protein n=1 Tax=Daphnia pulex TaxID=6669 RepID=E9G7A0_DAPPU|nr:hypothetical protein DAPPUDRAFT_238745 [Daphnia pulex]|eukprot:EFX84433.1 hypothetical protein DAPPUDRAFT_238745 [Daphnia pulex]
MELLFSTMEIMAIMPRRKGRLLRLQHIMLRLLVTATTSAPYYHAGVIHNCCPVHHYYTEPTYYHTETYYTTIVAYAPRSYYSPPVYTTVAPLLYTTPSPVYYTEPSYYSTEVYTTTYAAPSYYAPPVYCSSLLNHSCSCLYYTEPSYYTTEVYTTVKMKRMWPVIEAEYGWCRNGHNFPDDGIGPPLPPVETDKDSLSLSSMGLIEIRVGMDETGSNDVQSQVAIRFHSGSLAQNSKMTGINLSYSSMPNGSKPVAYNYLAFHDILPNSSETTIRYNYSLTKFRNLATLHYNSVR